ncbi:hypothetical protein GV794_23305 [Nocardia cyriacigeorgica]|jgi:hypothetical protein|uniref:DUF3592 domain-containing protein n=1 Tax=Nocardia cyriacigeorgica TaxID=135487 RepID=A0A6P1D6F8_9NOCA|nr:DUF3592 domain-containing protein [Nocardia cyriacigeorgica]NEW39720.1 hypothetical protein [Nocardia cyriacigeorgica]NEW46226.1 hypothetical protein [Nocardia cyriacigeorgica]NEW50210.1 hypothetical protein [Nocardia cyriacigeorgica]NEW58549.1 hypothetical protein [Nocardia cyriacigeorgica]
MDHVRVLRVVLGVTAGYLILLALWLGWVVNHTPDGTVPFQIMALVGMFGSCIGIGLMWTGRPSKADRQLARHGIEGWARVEHVRPLARTDHHSEMTELDLEFTVPGSESYRGTVVYDVTPADKERLAIGETISIRVDPANRDRVMFCL